ncbi:hypothetical protein SPRG_02978 [Saprolegnia parasitica CBS 223.65]|uniref:Uncharacterized protein n=1 Tax=Saprolegnia parasitica (strain CBS 223.65) TaxID=695850 RepID=A0A067D134_SAPPC|nr:hypothetical protein SPRG_02978 [Saprolegnia parasitica CBS 223.65]KDO32501.1 hypothetical protein SPRG_02978 [Saprolegnia parasitica CBS 223.65]|eukprot:XP_012196950.1 hypothetical protein SPRG_02978 [Saprolegnia parasitica CBS 223.65]
MLRREPTRLDVKDGLADEYEAYRDKLIEARARRDEAARKPPPGTSAEEHYVARAKAEREARLGSL